MNIYLYGGTACSVTEGCKQRSTSTVCNLNYTDGMFFL